MTFTAVTAQGKSVPISTGNAALAAIDTGTTLIGGPTADVQSIWNAVGGSAIPSMPGYYQFRMSIRSAPVNPVVIPVFQRAAPPSTSPSPSADKHGLSTQKT